MRRRLIRTGGERGSALMLMPAAVLVVVILAAIATDAAVVLLAERQLADLADSLANDAAAATDERAFYEDGRVVVDGPRARAFVAGAAPRRLDDELRLTGVATSLPRPDTVRVAVTATVELIFSPAVPGGPAVREVDAVSSAVAQRP